MNPIISITFAVIVVIEVTVVDMEMMMPEKLVKWEVIQNYNLKMVTKE